MPFLAIPDDSVKERIFWQVQIEPALQDTKAVLIETIRSFDVLGDMRGKRFCKGRDSKNPRQDRKSCNRCWARLAFCVKAEAPHSGVCETRAGEQDPAPRIRLETVHRGTKPAAVQQACVRMSEPVMKNEASDFQASV